MTARAGGRLLRPQLWAGLWLATSAVLVLFPEATDVVLSKVWLWSTALTISSLLLFSRRVQPHGYVPGWARYIAVVLPPTERGQWIAEAAAILAASESGAERRRQELSYLRSLPATAVTIWGLKLRHEREARRNSSSHDG